MNKFRCKRCGACCRPRWTVPDVNKLGNPVWADCWTIYTPNDVARAASFLGISEDEFISTYKLVDDAGDEAKRIGKTKEEFIDWLVSEYHADRDEFLSTHQSLFNYRLKVNDHNCPFYVHGDQSSCSIYEARPDMCRNFPSSKQLEERFDFYAPHCPGFEKEE